MRCKASAQLIVMSVQLRYNCSVSRALHQTNAKRRVNAKRVSAEKSASHGKFHLLPAPGQDSVRRSVVLRYTARAQRVCDCCGAEFNHVRRGGESCRCTRLLFQETHTERGERERINTMKHGYRGLLTLFQVRFSIKSHASVRRSKSTYRRGRAVRTCYRQRRVRK